MGKARNKIKKYLLQFISLKLTMMEVEEMSVGEMALGFLIEKPKKTNQRDEDLKVMLPAGKKVKRFQYTAIDDATRVRALKIHN